MLVNSLARNANQACYSCWDTINQTDRGFPFALAINILHRYQPFSANVFPNRKKNTSSQNLSTSLKALQVGYAASESQ